MNAVKANNIRMEFEDNDILALLSGEHNQHLAHIEKSLDVTLDSFGNSIKISGAEKATKTARTVIENLYKRIVETSYNDIDQSIVDDMLRWAVNGHQKEKVLASETLITWKKKIVAKTKGQADYLKLLPLSGGIDKCQSTTCWVNVFTFSAWSGSRARFCFSP